MRWPTRVRLRPPWSSSNHATRRPTRPHDAASLRSGRTPEGSDGEFVRSGTRSAVPLEAGSPGIAGAPEWSGREVLDRSAVGWGSGTSALVALAPEGVSVGSCPSGPAVVVEVDASSRRGAPGGGGTGTGRTCGRRRWCHRRPSHRRGGVSVHEAAGDSHPGNTQPPSRRLTARTWCGVTRSDGPVPAASGTESEARSRSGQQHGVAQQHRRCRRRVTPLASDTRVGLGRVDDDGGLGPRGPAPADVDRETASAQLDERLGQQLRATRHRLAGVGGVSCVVRRNSSSAIWSSADSAMCAPSPDSWPRSVVTSPTRCAREAGLRQIAGGVVTAVGVQQVGEAAHLGLPPGERGELCRVAQLTRSRRRARRLLRGLAASARTRAWSNPMMPCRAARRPRATTRR